MPTAREKVTLKSLQWQHNEERSTKDMDTKEHRAPPRTQRRVNWGHRAQLARLESIPVYRLTRAQDLMIKELRSYINAPLMRS